MMNSSLCRPLRPPASRLRHLLQRLTGKVQTAKAQRDAGESQARVERLRFRLVLLREDPMTLERLAREELGMVRPNDVVIVLLPDDAAGSK